METQARKDAARIANVWRAQGKDAAGAAFDAVVRERKLVRWEAMALADLVRTERLRQAIESDVWAGDPRVEGEDSAK
jgi:hypothetical protein